MPAEDHSDTSRAVPEPVPLSPGRKRALKARAQTLRPVVTVGKRGLEDGILNALEEALAEKELVKVKLQALKEQKRTVFAELASRTGSEIVLAVGHTVTLFRARPEGGVNLPD